MATTTTLPPQRMKNPALVIPEAMAAIQALVASTQRGGVSEKTLGLVHLRASQINGCRFCVDYGWKNGIAAEESGEHLVAVSAWRESPHFDDAERAASRSPSTSLVLQTAQIRCLTRSGKRPPDTTTMPNSLPCYS